jgi:hypothetical protein
LNKNDIVEIYSSDGVQVFRSFNFFKLCIYPLDQILTYEWHELYRRDESITAGMMEIVRGIFSRQIKGVHFSKFPAHTVEQLCGPDVSQIKSVHRFAAPLAGPSGEVFLFNAFQVERVSAN